VQTPEAESPFPRGARRRRVTTLRVFGSAFLLLIGGVAAVAAAQFLASSTAAWVSLACSGGAVLLTFVALALRRR
jgi:hypothetical protein